MKQFSLKRRQAFYRQMHTCMICQVLVLDWLLTATCCLTAAGEGQGGGCSQKVGPQIVVQRVIPGVTTCREAPSGVACY